MIQPGYFWFNIILIALGTFAIRGSIIAISGRIQISDRLRELFSFIPAAILPALAVPAAFYHNGQIDWLWNKERFFVLILATAVSYFSRSMLATISFGLIALYLVSRL